MTISKMTGKLSGIQAVNTSPLDNPFCQKMVKTQSVCKYCFSMRMLQTYRKSGREPWRKNALELSKPLKIIPKIKTPVVRFSAHGELTGQRHFLNLCKIAATYPEKTFTLWTKRKTIIQRNIKAVPENMLLVYSEAKLNKKATKPPKGFDKIFVVWDKKEAIERNVNINCGSKKCLDCMLCYTKNQTMIINEVLK